MFLSFWDWRKLGDRVVADIEEVKPVQERVGVRERERERERESIEK